MKKIFVIILFAFLILLPVNSKENSDAEWERVAPNNYVYKDTIAGTEGFYGYSFMLKSYNKGQYEPINGRQVLYTLGMYEINCLKHSYKIGTLDSYDDDGDFVNGDYNKYAQFQPIVEGTAIDVMASRLCRI